MRNLIGAVVLAIICFAAFSVFSQDENSLAYGESATGEITNRHFEVEFAFEAEVGDVVVITMTPEDTEAFRNPGILLLNEDYDVIGEAFDSYSVTLFYDVKDSGSYYILATRNDGRSGEGVGEFSLALSRAPVMENGQDLYDSATSELDRYYAVRADGDFDVSYQFRDGDFRPEVSINTIKSRGNGLESQISLTGPSLERGSIGASIRSESSELFIVKISQRVWDWSDNKFADYRIRLDLNVPASGQVVVERTNDVKITATTGINVRSGPGTSFSRVGIFQTGQQATAIGRNSAGTWVQMERGWVSAEIVTVDGDLLSLPVTAD